jgi:hypothetical protein
MSKHINSQGFAGYLAACQLQLITAGLDDEPAQEQPVDLLTQSKLNAGIVLAGGQMHQRLCCCYKAGTTKTSLPGFRQSNVQF